MILLFVHLLRHNFLHRHSLKCEECTLYLGKINYQKETRGLMLQKAFTFIEEVPKLPKGAWDNFRIHLKYLLEIITKNQTMLNRLILFIFIVRWCNLRWEDRYSAQSQLFCLIIIIEVEDPVRASLRMMAVRMLFKIQR